MIIQALMYILIVCCFMCLYRIYAGTTPADRAVAVDILGIIVIGFCCLLSVSTHKGFYMDIAIAWTLQSYIGVLAIAKYLEGKRFDE
jgi:multicomponent Na+:H+ antiporter subunit F